MLFWTQKRLLALIVVFCLGAVALCVSPAWSQKAGVGESPVTAGESSAPLTPKAPNSNATWNLTDILWGISRLQSSPQKLTAEQSAVVRSTVSGIIKGTNTIKNFENEVKSVLTAEQLKYVEYLESTGALDKIPNDLPDVEPGQDPLVQYVISVLEKK